MDNAIITTETTDLATVGRMADAYAARNTFAEYQSRRSPATLRTQRAALDAFAAFLQFDGRLPSAPSGDDLFSDPCAWFGMSHGLVEAFRTKMLDSGAAIATINNRLSCVKRYARLAMKAGVIDPDTMTLIKTVEGYAGKEAKRVDEKRAVTRIGSKKAHAVLLTPEQANALKTQPDTPQGRRDALMMALLLDHGLRCGEVALLAVTDFDLAKGTMTFYRPKVDKMQTHKLSADTLRALRAWLDSGDVLAIGPILRGSRKGGALTTAGMSERAITARVAALGAAVGIDGLSAHDCRHYWATFWAGRVDLFRLQEAGGWNSLAMPRKYTEWAKIANDGMA